MMYLFKPPGPDSGYVDNLASYTNDSKDLDAVATVC